MFIHCGTLLNKFIVKRTTSLERVVYRREMHTIFFFVYILTVSPCLFSKWTRPKEKNNFLNINEFYIPSFQ